MILGFIPNILKYVIFKITVSMETIKIIIKIVRIFEYQLTSLDLASVNNIV